MGAAAVLETAAETPPIRKSTINPEKPFSLGAEAKTGDGIMTDGSPTVAFIP